MKVWISDRAARAAERIDAHWRTHADDGSVFARELLEAIERLESGTAAATAHPTERRPHLRRMLLSKSRCHVYFESVGAEIRILHIWHANRERGPRL